IRDNMAALHPTRSTAIEITRIPHPGIPTPTPESIRRTRYVHALGRTRGRRRERKGSTQIQRFVTRFHFVITASLICPASCAQVISPILTEISLPTRLLSCAAWALLVVTS